jgi:hypothetical protein
VREERVVQLLEVPASRLATRGPQPDPYLDLLYYAAIIISAQGDLFRANDLALRILARADALELNAGRVTFLRSSSASRIAHYLETESHAGHDSSRCASNAPFRCGHMWCSCARTRITGPEAAQANSF